MGVDEADAGREPHANRQGVVALPYRMARLLRLLRNPVGVEPPRPVDQAKASIHGVEAMEAREHPLRGTAPSRRRAHSGGSNRQSRPRPLADQQQPGASHCLAQRLLRRDQPCFPRAGTGRLINRTAVYGPVRTVVWEGRSREAPPYPDFAQAVGLLTPAPQCAARRPATGVASESVFCRAQRS